MHTCNLNKKFNHYKHRISYLTGTCYNFEMEEFFSSFLRRAGMPASAGLSCTIYHARSESMNDDSLNSNFL